eukprot:3843047-Prymnesium_polylepis.1
MHTSSDVEHGREGEGGEGRYLTAHGTWKGVGEGKSDVLPRAVMAAVVGVAHMPSRRGAPRAAASRKSTAINGRRQHTTHAVAKPQKQR